MNAGVAGFPNLTFLVASVTLPLRIVLTILKKNLDIKVFMFLFRDKLRCGSILCQIIFPYRRAFDDYCSLPLVSAE